MSLFDWQPGRTVRLMGWPYTDRPARLLKRHVVGGEEFWRVELTDTGDRRVRDTVHETLLAPLPLEDESGLKPGERVLLLSRLLRGATGVLVRPSRWWGKEAWIVRFERRGPLLRSGKVPTTHLWPLDDVPLAETTVGARHGLRPHLTRRRQLRAARAVAAEEDP